MILDTRRESLTPELVQGIPQIDGLLLYQPTTGSGIADLNVNIGSGVVSIPPVVQQVAAQADFACGAAITDGESLPVTIVAYFLPSLASILFAAVAGTSHTTPSAAKDSRDYYATDAAIEAAIPSTVEEGMYTVVGTEVFARSGASVTQHHDLGPRSWAVMPDSKYQDGDDLSTYEPDPGSMSAAVALNTTHRSSDGTDHANVVVNDTHVAGDGSDHADVATNTTHSTSDGTDHANVVVNDTHVAGDGSDHADVAANTAAHARIITGTATIANGNTSVTVLEATLGGAYGGSEVILTMAEAPTSALRLYTTWSGNDLVIHDDQDNTADLDVFYLVDART